MKKFFLLAAFLLCASPCFAQLVLPSNTGTVQAPIDANGWTSYKLVLTQNVTSFSFVILPNGTPPPSQAIRTVEFVENATGGFTVTFAVSINSPCTISTGANAVTVCQFSFDATNNTWTGIGGSGGSSPGGSGYVLASVTGPVIQPAKGCADATVTSGSATITSAGQCQWTSSDVGKKIFATNICSSSQCGFTLAPTAKTILPSTQTAVARIAIINSATSITVDCNAPANCVSPNASATNTGFAVVLYGTDQTTAINTAYNTAVTSAGCPTIVYPQGMYFFSSQIWAASPSATDSCHGNGIHQLSQPPTINGGGPVIEGQGQYATIFVPTPDFSFPCSAGTGACIGGQLNATYRDFAVNGFGQSFIGAGLSGTPLFGCQQCSMQNLILSSWMNDVLTSSGISTPTGTVGFNTLFNVQAVGWGGVNGDLVLSGDGNLIVDSIFGFSAGPAINMLSGATYQTTGLLIYAPNGGNLPTIDATCTQWVSTNDKIFYNGGINSGAADEIKIESGCNAGITNLITEGSTAFDNGIEVVAGGTLTLSGYHSATGKNKGLTVAGTFIDGCGNTPSYGSVTNSVTGSYFGSCSITGTTQTNANWSTPAGSGAGQWGTTPSTACPGTLFAVAGDSHKESCTITVGSGTVGANPVLTVTFPTPFLLAPSCDAKMTSGTATIANFTVGVPTATSVAVTYQGTPAASSTMGVIITCGP